MDTQKIIDYWFKSANKDFQVAQSLFNSKYYLYSLFFCHLTIEKILKALAVKRTKQHAPYTHNLVELAQKANLSLEQIDFDLLDKLTDFNLEARYPDFKLEAYQKATKNLAGEYLQKTKELYLWLKKMI